MTSMAQAWHFPATRCYRTAEFHDMQQIRCVIKILSFATFTGRVKTAGRREIRSTPASLDGRVGRFGRPSARDPADGRYVHENFPDLLANLFDGHVSSGLVRRLPRVPDFPPTTRPSNPSKGDLAMPSAPKHRAVRAEARHRRGDGRAATVHPIFGSDVSTIATGSTHARYIGRVGALAIALGVAPPSPPVSARVRPTPTRAPIHPLPQRHRTPRHRIPRQPTRQRHRRQWIQPATPNWQARWLRHPARPVRPTRAPCHDPRFPR
jgi:hypothetical protein